jgi:ATP-binding cassette subfamily F protein 3
MAEEAVDRPQQQRRIRVQLQAAQRSGDVMLRLSGVAVGYARGRPVLRVPEVEVRRGDRVALVGPNGAGKTTLVRSLLGQLELLEGEIRFGTGVQPGYLAQAHDYLQGDLTVLEAVRQVKPTMLPEQVRGLLGSFLFTGDDAFKRVDELSGGQRSRVALARLVVQDANFLVLDEPTNHLDIASQEVLEEVLDQYPGTLLLVTHDRYLIQALATHVWDAAGGELRCFEGDWAEYLRWRERQESRIEEAGDEPSGRQAQRQAQKEDRRARKQGEKLQQRQQEVEADIHRLEGGLRDLSLRIGQAGEAQDVELVRRLGAEYQRMESALKDLWWQWEQVARELEQV